MPTEPLNTLAEMAAAPWEYDFFQALRRIECEAQDKPRLGHSVRLADDRAGTLGIPGPQGTTWLTATPQAPAHAVSGSGQLATQALDRQTCSPQHHFIADISIWLISKINSQHIHRYPTN